MSVIMRRRCSQTQIVWFEIIVNLSLKHVTLWPLKVILDTIVQQKTTVQVHSYQRHLSFLTKIELADVLKFS